MSQTLYPHCSPPRKLYEHEKETQKLLVQKSESIQKFMNLYIFNESKQYRQNIKIKQYLDQAKYEGEMNELDQKHGIGIYQYPNGDKYFGEWANDLFNGQGTYVFNMGERYEGELLMGKKNGYGIYCYLNGNLYKGEWQKDKKNGKVKFHMLFQIT